MVAFLLLRGRLGKSSLVSQEERMRRSAPSSRGVLEVDWPFFGELCRALALRVAREYQPEVVLGVAKAGVIPGGVLASILQCAFASMVETRKETDVIPSLLAGPPAVSGGVACSWWMKPATPAAPSS